MTKFERFTTENPGHPLVARMIKLADQPMSLTGSLGKLIGQVSRLADEAYG